MMLLIVCCLVCSACSSKKQDSETESKTETTAFEGIDFSSINKDDIIPIFSTLELNKSSVELEDIIKRSDVVIKGELIKLDSNVSEQTNSIYTDYTFKVSKVYKGDVDAELTINALGGIMKYDDYMEQLIKYGAATEDDKDSDAANKYASTSPNEFTPLLPNGEYIVCASYDDEKKSFYPTNYFYGILNCKDGKDQYTRYTIKDDGAKDTFTLDEIENSIEK